MAKLFVFDFHGVLEKGNERAVIKTSNAILEKFGYKERFTFEQIDKLYGKKWYQYFEELLPNEPHEKHIELQNACVTFSIKNSEVIADCIELNDNVHFILDKISKVHSQVLISNMEPEALPIFLNSVKITKYFDEGNAIAINAHKRELSKTKGDALREFVKGKKFDSFVFIGDSPQDLEPKKEFGGVTYMYAHPGREFKKCEADYYIRDLRDILKEIS